MHLQNSAPLEDTLMRQGVMLEKSRVKWFIDSDQENLYLYWQLADVLFVGERSISRIENNSEKGGVWGLFLLVGCQRVFMSTGIHGETERLLLYICIQIYEVMRAYREVFGLDIYVFLLGYLIQWVCMYTNV